MASSPVRVGLLEHDHTVGTLVRFTGTVVFAYAMLRGFAYARTEV